MLLGGWVGDRRPSATLIPTSSKVIREKCDLLDGGSLSHVVIESLDQSRAQEMYAG